MEEFFLEITYKSMGQHLQWYTWTSGYGRWWLLWNRQYELESQGRKLFFCTFTQSHFSLLRLTRLKHHRTSNIFLVFSQVLIFVEERVIFQQNTLILCVRLICFSYKKYFGWEIKFLWKIIFIVSYFDFSERRNFRNFQLPCTRFQFCCSILYVFFPVLSSNLIKDFDCILSIKFWNYHKK